MAYPNFTPPFSSTLTANSASINAPPFYSSSTPPFYPTFTNIPLPSPNPYTSYVSSSNSYTYGSSVSAGSLGYYNSIHPYSQPVGYQNSSSSYAPQNPFSKSLTPMASQPNQELLVAMKESVREIKDSLLALRDKIREEERLSALTDEMRPKERFPRLKGSAVDDSKEAVEDAAEKVLFNAIDNTISDSSNFAQSSPVSGTKPPFIIPPPKLDVLPAPAVIKAVSSQARWKSIKLTMGEEKSDNPTPKPPHPKPQESDLFTGNNSSLLVAECSFTRKMVAIPPLESPGTNPNPSPPLKPPDPSFQKAASTMAPPPPEPPDRQRLTTEHSSPSFSHTPDRPPSPSDLHPACMVHSNKIAICDSGSQPPYVQFYPPFDLQQLDETQSQSFNKSTVCVTRLKPTIARHVSLDSCFLSLHSVRSHVSPNLR